VAQSPDKLPSNSNSCSPDSKAWLNARLLPNALPYNVEGACFALGSPGDDVTLAKADVLAPGGNTRFTQRAVNPITPVANGLIGIASTSGSTLVHAPLGLVEYEGVLAGMPHVSLIISSLTGANEAAQDCSQTLIDNSPGCDSIIFVGVGVKKAGGLASGQSPNYVLIDDQVQPLRGLGIHEVDLVGIAERVFPGDELALLFYANHPQFFSSVSRDLSIPAVNITGTVSLPLYAVDADKNPDPEADAETVLTGSHLF
jgi:ABC-2 type transport system ATP-binding protein